MSRQGGNVPVPPLDALEELQRLGSDVNNPDQTMELLERGVLRSLAGVIAADSIRRRPSLPHDVDGDRPTATSQSGGVPLGKCRRSQCLSFG